MVPYRFIFYLFIRRDELKLYIRKAVKKKKRRKYIEILRIKCICGIIKVKYTAIYAEKRLQDICKTAMLIIRRKDIMQ